MEKVLVAMSGGVDSSVAAFLMQDAGFTCAGGTMQLCDEALLGKAISTDAEDARNVAQRLGLPFHLMDCVSDFKEKVVDHFIGCYESGGTPNPCIQCNRHLKFDVFLKNALALGYDYIATGHYAKIRQDEATGRYLLQRCGDDRQR